MKQFIKANIFPFNRLYSSSSIEKAWLRREKVKETLDKNLIQPHLYEKLKNSFVSEFLNLDHKNLFFTYLRKKSERVMNYAFVMDADVACDIVNRITEDEPSNDCQYVEGNPGVGMLTLLLLNSGFQVSAYDNSNLPKLSLVQIKKKFPNLQINTANMFVRAFFPNTVLQSDKKVKIVGVVPRLFYFFSLAEFASSNWNCLDNITLYLIANSDFVKGVMNFEKLRSVNFKSHVLFNLFFDYEILTTYERQNFLPPPPKNLNETMYLVKIKKNNKVIKEIDQLDFRYFVDLLSVFQKNRYDFVIPVLENNAPNFGFHLIREGFSAATQTSDLKPFDTIKLFTFLRELGLHKNFPREVTYKTGNQKKVEEEEESS